ncbi:MAG: hypothetical protein ACLPND_08045 [Candidatus Korobacteraceae bacterium]
MKSRLMLAMVLLVGQAFILLVDTPVRANAAQNPENHAKSGKTPAKQPPTAQNKEDAGGHENEDQAATPSVQQTQPSVTINAIPPIDVKRDWIDYASPIIGILLFLVGAATGGVILYQSVQTKIAAQAGRDSAKAAERNADILAASERAWVLVDNIQEPFLQPLDSMPFGGQRLTHCIFFLKNFGNSPATIVAAKFEMQVGDRRDIPPSAALYDMAPLTLNQNPYIIPQSTKPWPNEAKLTPQAFIRNAAERDEIIVAKAKFLWLCGIVRYFDPFVREREERETRFCYMYETLMGSPFWKPAGSAGMNQAK